MSDSITTISIIGRGDFGRLISSLIPTDIQHHAYGSQDTAENIEQIAQSDVIFLSIPLESYPVVLDLLAPHLHPNSLVVDVCSVKVLPKQLLEKHLPNHSNILLTHPLFGPQSWASEQQHTLVVTSKASPRAIELLNYCQSHLGLNILHMSCEEHDQRMAEIHALTFFIARGLSHLNLKSDPFMTPSFQQLLNLVTLDQSQSEALFQTIENGNPFASRERQKLMKELAAVHSQLELVSESSTVALAE